LRRLPFAAPAAVESALDEVVSHLHAGGLIAYPTETVYGFGGLVRDDALAELSALKSRDESKPFLILVRSATDFQGVQWTSSARKLADRFWPGALSIALCVDREMPTRILSEEGTVALRATPHEGIRMLLERLGEPITSTSANLPRSAPATSADEVAHVLRELEREDVLILDGGQLPLSASSTLVDCSVDPPRVLREGAITTEALLQIVDLNG
jgi:L-threonylcarbamoyladenylate synthase